MVGNVKWQIKIQMKGLLACEKQGGWSKAFWWLRMIFGWWAWYRKPSEPKFFLAA